MFIDLYHFNDIENGLTYITSFVGSAIGGVLYIFLLRRLMNSSRKANIEMFLIPAMMGCFSLPVGLFIFAWGSSTHTHWAAPVMGTFIFNVGSIMIFQSIFAYLGRGFPRFLASVFGGNCLMRSWLAAVFPLFANALFENTGSKEFPVGIGGSILAVISAAMIAIPFFFYRYAFH